ncbi:MAG: hypothetical protein M1587_00110 [Thaumarchaeota archaeon]|nr:hypothetical protein [Nitrososphaerota archaeon]
MNLQKIQSEKKAISPIIATLLLILIAIAAGVVVYAYVLGFMGGAINQSSVPKTSDEFSINAWSYSVSGTTLTIYVQNTGQNTVNITSVYVYSSSNTLVTQNVTLGSGAAGSGYIITPGSTATVVAKTITLTPGTQYQLRVTSVNGGSASSTLQKA